MAVIVKYVVVRNGKEVMTFTSKKEADAHDRTLDIAEGLYEFLQNGGPEIADDTLDELTFFLAKHRDQVATLLRGKKLADGVAPAEGAPPPAQEKAKEPPSSKNKSEAPKSPRKPKKAVTA